MTGDRLRVVLFTSSLGGGGAEAHALRLVNHLPAERFDVVVAVTREAGEAESRLRPGLRLHRLRRGRPRAALPRVLSAAAPLRSLVREWRPAVVCAVQDHAGCAALLAGGTRGSGPAVTVSIQNTVSRKYRRATLGRRVLKPLMRRLYPRAGCLVAASAGVARDLVEWLPAARGRVRVIYNAAFEPGIRALAAEGGVPDRRPLVVACGRLTEQKGFGFLLRAMAEVSRSLPAARLVIVGDGPERPRLERLADELGLGDAVRLPGFDPNPFRYMAASSVFVSSSLWEGFGNVIVEAMACGAAVVATDCPHGPAEIVRDGVDGLLVRRGDPGELAAAIRRLLADRELAGRLAASARERSEDFSAAAAAAAYGRLFEELAAGRGAAGAAGGTA